MNRQRVQLTFVYHSQDSFKYGKSMLAVLFDPPELTVFLCCAYNTYALVAPITIVKEARCRGEDY